MIISTNIINPFMKTNSRSAFYKPPTLLFFRVLFAIRGGVISIDLFIILLSGLLLMLILVLFCLILASLGLIPS